MLSGSHILFLSERLQLTNNLLEGTIPTEMGRMTTLGKPQSRPVKERRIFLFLPLQASSSHRYDDRLTD
jgi:hypothetical protein